MNSTLTAPVFKNAYTSLLIQDNIDLAPKNWFKTGGPARFYCQPNASEQFAQALIWAHENNQSIFILGEGANILISDTGFAGLVIRPCLNSIEFFTIDDTAIHVRAGAGVSFSQLINRCLEFGAIGLEELSGIPGTVGGSVFINIHFFKFFLSDFLVKATVINKKTGMIQEVDNAWFNFGYDTSTLHENNFYLVDATFKIKKVDALQAAYARGRRDEMIRYRAWRYPTALTCGSFFRNFHEHEVTCESNGKKMIYVAYYFDKLGFKGELASGDAIVSHLHANMIVNKGNATSQDIINLARTMQEQVKNAFGIVPQPECRLIGFEHNPLL